MPCSGLCLTCSNSTFCLSCTSNFLWKGNCVPNSQCPTSYYADIRTLSCLSCNGICLNCQFSSTNCISCNPNSSLPFLLNNTCLSNCLSTKYYNTSSNGIPMCNLCNSPCQTCSNATYCLSCIAGYMLSGGLCSTLCNAGYFFNSSTIDCSACSINCLICNTAIFCQLCKSGFYIHNLNSSTNECLQNCPSTYYASSQGGSCKPCIYPCFNCTSSLNCLSCQTGIIYLNRCISSCPDTTFYDKTAGTCLACTGTCLTCFGTSTYCLSCINSHFLYSINNTCTPTCYLGTYS